MLLALNIADEVFGAVGPGVVSCAVFFAVFPVAFEALAVRVVQHALSAALVVLELTFVDLSIGPHIRSLSVLLPHVEAAVENAPIWPLKEPLTVHCVVEEGTLVDFSTRRDASAEPINLTFLEEALENGIVWVHFEANSVWLQVFLVDLAAIHCTTLARLKVEAQLSLRIHVIVDVVVCVVIERPKHFVDVLHSLVCDISHHIVVVREGKVMIHLDDVASEALPQVDHDVFLSPLFVLHDHLRLRQVDVEVIKRVAQASNMLLQPLFLVVEFDQRVGLEVADQGLCLALKAVHLVAHVIFLLQHLISHLVKRVVEVFEDVFHFLLVHIELVH